MADVVESLIIKVTAENLESTKQKLRDLGVAFDETNQKIASAPDKINALKRSLDPLYRATEDLTKSQERLQRALDANKVSQDDFQKYTQLATKRFEDQKKAIEEGTGSLGKHSGAVSTATREFRALFDELSSGRTRMVPGTLAIIANRVIGIQGATLAWGVAAVAVPALVLVAMAKVQASFAEVTNAMQLMGNTTGFTRGQMEQLAVSTADGGKLSIGTYRDIETAIIRVGGVTGENFKKMIAVSADWAKVTGQDAPAAMAEVAQAIKGGISGVEQLDQKYQLLTAAQLKAADAAFAMGDVQRAGAIVLQAVADRSADVEKNLGFVERAYDSVKAAAGRFFNFIGSIGKQSTSEETLAQDQAVLDSYQKKRDALQKGGTAGTAQLPGQSLDNINRLIAKQQELVASDQKVVAAEQAKTKAAADAKVTDNDTKSVNAFVRAQDQANAASQRSITAQTESYAATARATAIGNLEARGLAFTTSEAEAAAEARRSGLPGLKAMTDEQYRTAAASVAAAEAIGKQQDEIAAATASAKTAKEILQMLGSESENATKALAALMQRADGKELDAGSRLWVQYNADVDNARAKYDALKEAVAKYQADVELGPKLQKDLADATNVLADADKRRGDILKIATDLQNNARDAAFAEHDRLIAEAGAVGLTGTTLAQYNETKREAAIHSQVYASALKFERGEIDLTTGAVQTLEQAQGKATAAADEAVAAQRKIFDGEQAARAADKAESAWDKAIKNAAQQADNTLVKSIENAFDGKKVEDWHATAKKMIADLAAQALNIVILKPLLASVLSGVGLSGAANQLVPGAAAAAGGGASGASGILGMLGNASSLGNVFSGGGILSSTGAASNFLFGGVSDPAYLSPSLFQAGGGTILPSTTATPGIIPGSSGGTFLGGTLGDFATGIGGAAGIYGGISGLAGGQHNTIGMIGDAAQIAGGSIALMSALGLIASTGVGLPIAAIGAIVAMLFGQKKPKNISGLDINSVGANGTLSPLAMGNDNGANTDQLQQLLSGGAQPFLQGLSSQYGADFSGVNIGAYSHQTQGKDDLSVGFTGPVPGQDFALDPKNINGSLGDVLTHLGLAMLQSASKVSNADVALARFNIDINDTAENIQKYLSFASQFQTNIESLKGGGGFDLTATIKGSAAQNATQLTSQVNDFVATTAKLFAGGPQIKEANDAIAQYLRTLIGGAEAVDKSLSPMEVAVKTASANIDALTPLLKQFGLTSDEIAADLTKSLQKLAAEEKASLTALDNTARGMDVINQLQKVITDEQANIRDLAALPGGDTSMALKLATDQASNLLDSLTNDQLNEVIKSFQGVAGASQILQAASTKLFKGMQTDTQTAATALNTFRKSMAAFADSLLVGDLSPLSPQDQLNAAQGQFYSDLSAANGGDTEAQGRVQGDATTYLNLARAFYASSQQYTDIFDQVRTALGATKTVAQTQADLERQGVSIAQQQLQTLQAIQQGLAGGRGGAGGGGLNVGGTHAVGTSAADVSAIAGFVTGVNPDGSPIFAPGTFNNTLPSTPDNLYGDPVVAAYEATHGTSDPYNNGGYHPPTMAQLQQTADALGITLDQSIASLHGLPHMAGGGMITGGIAGIDSVPILGMPGEGILNHAGMRALATFNSGRVPANDNGALLAAVNNLTNEVSSMRKTAERTGRTTAAAAMDTAETLAEHLPRVAENTGTAARQAERLRA